MLGAAPTVSIFRRTASLSVPLLLRSREVAGSAMQSIGSDAIGHLATGQQERRRPAEAVGQHADIAANRRSKRPSDRVRRLAHRRDALLAGAMLSGPVIVNQFDTTMLVPVGWQGMVHTSGSMILHNSVRGAPPVI